MKFLIYGHMEMKDTLQTSLQKICVTLKLENYIKKQFAKISKKNNCEFVLEKTCSNSLRVPFVDEVFPKAKFIFIYRNGIDASYSIMQRWQSDFDLIYSLKKLKYVPKSLMYFGIKFLKNRYYKMTKANRLKYWGQDSQINLIF